MPRIPFINATWRDELPRTSDVERRLRDSLHRMRERKRDLPDGGEPEPIDKGDRPFSMHPLLTDADKARIRRRAAAFCDRAKTATGLGHLTRDARERIAVLRNGAEIISIPSEHRADEIAAALHEQMPWMALATERVWQAIRASVRNGDAGLRLPPMLLISPPGIGKSHWARMPGCLIGVPTTVIDASGEPAGFSIVGTQRGWGTAGPGRAMETILASLVANPLIIVDEVEKAGSERSSNGTSYSLTNALLPLLERSTAGAWSCPYFQVRFDMSWIGWVMTANDARGLSAPFLSRVPPLRLSALTTEELMGFARRKVLRREMTDVDEVVAAIGAAVDGARGPDLPSLRTVVRMIDRAGEILERPRLH